MGWCRCKTNQKGGLNGNKEDPIKQLCRLRRRIWGRKSRALHVKCLRKAVKTSERMLKRRNKSRRRGGVLVIRSSLRMKGLNAVKPQKKSCKRGTKG